MHSWTTRRLLESTPGWVVLGIFVLGCGRTNREFEGGPNNHPPDYRAVPVGTGSGGGDGSGGADSSEGAAGESGSEPGAAGQPASGADPGAGPGTDAGTEPDTGTEPDPGTGPDAGTEPEPPVYPSDCTRSSKSVKDPNTGITWNTVYYCGNDGAVGVYEKANYNDKVGVMDSTNSWFVCWKAGAEHGGKNNIWYYTQGSVSVAGWGGRAAWGFMPAVDVHTQHDPDSAIPRCTF